MNKCRICLKGKRKLSSIFDDCDNYNTNYSQMLMYIFKFKIVKDEGVTEMICEICKGKLQEAYSFKQLILQSDYILHEKNQLSKRVFYDNYEDLKVKIEFAYPKSSIPLKRDLIKSYFTNGSSYATYNNTIITKIKNKNGLEHLNSVKEEISDYDEMNNYLDNENNSEDKTDKYDINDDKYTPLKTKCNKSKDKRISKVQQLCTPIKPKYIEHLKLVPTLKKRVKCNKTICPYCGKMYKNLRGHLRNHTAKESDKKHKCDICLKAFYVQAMLKAHLLRHTGKKNFKCDQCTAIFYDRGTLKSHKISHTTVSSYKCDMCGSAFKRKYTLFRHVQSHSLANRNVKCDLCNMTFFTKYGLKNHMLVHTEERRFRCEICTQPYKNKRDFIKHCFNKHGVTLKRRSVYVMNAEVLKREKSLMHEMKLRLQGVIQDDKPINPFEGPQANQAFKEVVKVLMSEQTPIDSKKI